MYLYISLFVFGWLIYQWVSCALISFQTFPFYFWLWAGNRTILFCASSLFFVSFFFFIINVIDFQIWKKKKKKSKSSFSSKPKSSSCALSCFSLIMMTASSPMTARSVELAEPLCVCLQRCNQPNHRHSRGSMSLAEVCWSKVLLQDVVISFFPPPALPSSQGAWPPDSRAKRKEDSSAGINKASHYCQRFSAGYF